LTEDITALRPEGIIENPDDYNQVMDILDVWFDSRLLPFTLHDCEDSSEDSIADVYMEQTNTIGWFHSSLLQSVAHHWPRALPQWSRMVYA
jgi:isoleucyl-tRNA synthetase